MNVISTDIFATDFVYNRQFSRSENSANSIDNSIDYETQLSHWKKNWYLICVKMREKFKLWNIVQVHVNFFSISKLKKKKK